MEELLQENINTTMPITEVAPEAPKTPEMPASGSISPLHAELATANLDTMSYAAMKSLFMRLGLEAPSLKKADIQPVLKAEQSKLKK